MNDKSAGVGGVIVAAEGKSEFAKIRGRDGAPRMPGGVADFLEERRRQRLRFEDGEISRANRDAGQKGE